MATSRGNAISAYIPAFSKGAQVYGANIASGVVTSAHIADGTVVAGDIGAGSVTSAKIGTGAVTNAKIAAGAVTSAKLGTAAVVNAAISAKAITSAKIRAAFLSGTLVSGKTVTAVAHGLGVKPKLVVACGIVTRTQASGATPVVVQVGVSASTSTNIYLIASGAINAATKYAAYVQL